MKIISWNVNGIRSVHKKGFVDFIKAAEPDILCLQEIKAKIADVPKELTNITGYESHFNEAAKPGYSGTAVYTHSHPNKVIKSIKSHQFDDEGRALIVEYPSFTFINVYIPHGGRSKEKLSYKLDCYKDFFEYIKKVKTKNLIIAGDFNIAHTELDLARPKNNKNNIMFTPAERGCIEYLISLGVIDTFREFHKDGEHYTWWPYFANARQRNIGWRIDYVFVSKNLRPKLKNAFIMNEIIGSDHCPVGIEIDL